MNTQAPDPGELEGQVSNAHAVEELVRANADSNATMVRLVEQVRKDADARSKKIDLLEQGQRQTRMIILMVAVVLAAMVVIGVINAVNIAQTRRNAATTAEIAKDAAATNGLLFDCFNSRGVCGKRNAEQNKKILDEVKKYELTGFYCARTNPQPVDESGDKFLACMKRLYPTGPILNGR